MLGKTPRGRETGRAQFALRPVSIQRGDARVELVTADLISKATLAGDRICAYTRFESGVLPWFGLPRSLPNR
jgi:hypothetical protein